ncbi:MAG: Cytosol aminopeptidase [Anaerolineales bacterium]|nr:Cytosol aminopeptidase [Anaerolineales bacterium]
MDVTTQQGFVQEVEADAVIVNLFEGVSQPGGATGAVDGALDGAITDLIAGGDFKGKLGETAVLYARGAMPAPRVVIVGLGKSGDFDLEGVRKASAAAAKRAKKLGVERLATIVHGAGIGELEPREAAQATVEGALLATYEFKELKTETDEDEASELAHLVVVEADAGKVDVVQGGARVGEIMVRAVQLARDLGNRPGNVATPRHLAETAQEIAGETGLRCEIFDEEQMRELGMGVVLGVAQGSEEPARFIVLEHNAGRDDLDTIVFAGKGLTFDTGGISIKQSKGMENMKFDMMGGAAVLGAMQAVGELDLPLHVVGLVPATENMPGGAADKPGDVLTALNGKTIEVINTDAEGRLILADGLSYAQRFAPDAVIDLATLTGAAMVALGRYATGMFTNDEALAGRLSAAAEATGERVWLLPLFDEHKEEVESDVADVKNVGKGRFGGASIGAAFLANFVGDYPWVHLDIAPTGWTDEAKGYTTKGATGVGVRLLVRFLQDWG